MVASKSFFCTLLLLVGSSLLTTVAASDHMGGGLAARARHGAAAARRAPQPVPVDVGSSPFPGSALKKRQATTHKRCKTRRPDGTLVNPSTTTTTTSTTTSSTPTSTRTTTTQAPPPPPPPPTSTWTPPPAPTTRPPPANNGYFGGTNHGEVTFYDVSVGPVACGQRYNNNDYVAALAFPAFDNYPGSNGNPNQSPICGRPIVVTLEGKSITVRVVDKCAACSGADVDLTEGAFRDLTNGAMGRGRIGGLQWRWA